MRKLFYFLLFSFFLISFPLSAMASIEDYSAYNKIAPEKMASANGGFEIYIKAGNDWNFVNYMAFDEFYRQQTCDLSSHINSNQGVTLRIVQKGGQAAHIDTIHIGNAFPDMKPSSRMLSKLSKKDFDVIDAFGKSMVVEFKGDLSDSILSMVARVEGENISKIPFQFPVSNTYGVIDREASFYTYDMKSGNAGQPLHSGPLFNQSCIPGTGHPTANTYGWVWNDADYIYAYLDFVPDNTCDGEKDYAAMHIKETEGVKSFRVSVNENQFGRPAFEYTAQADYQHKAYRFKIPRAEVDGDTEELQVAFSAYGTAALPEPEYMHEVLLNTDPSSGNDVPVLDKYGSHTIPSINYRVQVLVNETSNWVVGIIVLKWDEGGSEFLGVSYPLGVDQGPGGMQAVEWGVAMDAIDNPSGFKGYFHSSEYGQVVNDYTSSFDYSITNTPIPTLSEWGMIFFALTLMAAAAWLLRKRSRSGAMAAVVVLFMMVGVVFAATIILDDGTIDDWGSIGPVVTDIPGDSSINDPNEDILRGYVTHDNDYIYFRVDYTGAGPLILQN